MKPLAIVGAIALLAAAFAVFYFANPTADIEARLEKNLIELKELHERGLITTEVYNERLRTLLDTSASQVPGPSLPPPGPPATPSQDLPLTGIWHILTDNPEVFAPNIPMTKSLGVVLWKIQWRNNRLAVFEHVPSYEVLPSADPNDYPYEKLALEDVRIDVQGGRVSFKVDRSVGAFEAYELFDFDHIETDKISGKYTYYDPHSGVPGYGPKWVVTIRLGRYEL